MIPKLPRLPKLRRLPALPALPPIAHEITHHIKLGFIWIMPKCFQRRDPLMRWVFLCLVAMFFIVLGSHRMVTAANAQENQVRAQFNSAVIATHEEKLSELRAEVLAGQTDRVLLHAEILKITSETNSNFNELNLRLVADEAKIATAVWLVGAFLVISQGVWVLLHISDRLRRPRATDAGVARARDNAEV